MFTTERKQTNTKMMKIAILLALAAVAIARSIRMDKGMIPMALWKKANTDGDNLLSEAEHMAFYSGMDADSNNEVSMDEWNAACTSFTGTSVMDCSTVFAMTDMDGSGAIDRADGALQRQYMDKNTDGNVDMKEFVGTWMMLVKEAPFVGLFMQSDKDGNGEISPADLALVFQSFDADGDSSVTNTEFVTLWTTNGFGDDKSANMLFGLADQDKSGALDASDMTAMFQGFDADANGAVDKKEFVGKFLAVLSAGGKPGKPGKPSQ